MAIFSLFAECRAPLQKHRILHYDSDSDLDDDMIDDLIILNSARSDSRRLSTRRSSKVKVEAKVTSTMAMVADLREDPDEDAPIVPLRSEKKQLNHRTTRTLPRAPNKENQSREWHKKYPATYDEIKTNKKEVTRQNIILEICNSHSDFYEDLIHVKKVYVRGLELFGKLDSDTISNLFGNLDEVIRVNDGLEDELNKLRDDKGIINHIGGALRDWVPKLSCYAEYARGLVLKRKKLEDCFNEDKVQAFLTTAESAKFARKLTIWSFLDAPRSNLPRLKLQLERLHKNTPSGNEDVDLLPEVIDRLDQQIKQLNDAIAAAEFQSIISTLHHKNQTNSDSVIPYDAKQLLFRGNVKYKNRVCELLLFDTCVAIARQKGKSERELLKVEELTSCSLEQPDQSESKLALRRILPSAKLIMIHAQNFTDAMTWVDEFKKAKDAYVLWTCTNPTVVRSGSTLTTSSTSTATSSISTMSTDFDQSESGSIPEVPSRRPRDSKMERPQSWVAKFFPGSRRNEPDSPQQPRRKTIDVADKTNTEAINKAISSSTKPAYTGSMVNLSENSDFEPNEHLAPIKVERSPSSVSGTSFASSDSEGFASSSLHMSRRTAIYTKPKLGGCEDEPLEGPTVLPIHSDDLPPPPPPPALPPRPVNIHMEPLIPVYDMAQSRPIPTATIGVIEEHVEHQSTIALQESDEEDDDDESEQEIEKSGSSSKNNTDSDSFDTPESFDSGHPTSPTRDQQGMDENDLEREFLKTMDADVDAITPRSLALSEMGSEVDVDQSMNSMSAFNDGYKSLNIIANGHIELDTNVDNISDSGTDSFSEQMEDELDALACSIVGHAIGLVKTEMSLPPIP